MMLAHAIGMRRWVVALAGLSLATSTAAAEHGWMPVVSTVAAAAFVEAGGSSPPGPDLVWGWEPVVMVSPAPGAAPVVTSAAVLAEADRGPAGEQRQAQHAGQPPSPPALVGAPGPVRKPAEARPAAPGLAQDYCISIADAAADARFAWQKQTLSEMEKELEGRIAVLEKRTAEYREWLARRDAFASKAQATLVRIYARMRPDAAASQLAAMDEETAAAVLTKLDPRNASAILNEMPPGPAVRLTTTIAGAAKVTPESGTAPATGGGKS
ncbi:MAG: hypothetical protein KJZ80_06185 [Hyphomicrobiaceae bacterium]|nr:hypothetical protein [Hyphomicrobiaceae bacterium]